MEEPQAEAAPQEVARARELIRADFQRVLDDDLRHRGLTRPDPTDDDVIFGMAEAAMRRFHAATAADTSLPRLSRVQLLEIMQSLYFAHGSLGPFRDVLEIPGAEDIHFMGTRGGRVVFADHVEDLPNRFASEEEMAAMVRHYAELGGKHFDPANPVVTVTLRDGSRLNAILPPVSKPLVITIRKQQLRRFLTLNDLVVAGALPAAAVPILEAAVVARLNILISGATGSGKTTLARVLALMIPERERVCVLETETELWLHELRERDCFSLEARDANVEGAGQITLRDLLQYGVLRQRPDRIIVGEVRGEETIAMLRAMHTGHGGGLTTIHAIDASSAIGTLEMLAMLTERLSAPAVRALIGKAVDLVIHLSSFRRPGREVRRVASMAFVDENREVPEGGVGIHEFCTYQVAEDDWVLGEYGIHPPNKVEAKLRSAGLDPAVLRTRGD